MLVIYSTNDVELSAPKHHAIMVFVLYVEHFFVRVHIPIIIVFVLDSGFVQNLGWADMIDATKTA
jgi:hypothetical protein